MPTHTPPHLVCPPQSEIAHAFGLPTMVAIDALTSMRLTLAMMARSSTPLLTYFLIAP